MKSFSKVLLAGAVAVMAIAVSAAPSEAAKKKRGLKGAAVPVSACSPGAACTGAPNPLQEGRGVVYMCGGDAKWVAALNPGCSGAGCPPPCM